MSGQLTIKKLPRLLNLLRIDFYFFLFHVGSALIAIPVNQLVQDKICLNGLSLHHSICRDLTNVTEELEYGKNYVLEKTTTIKNNQLLVSLAPGILLSLFLGRWIDLYPDHLRYLLALPCLGGLIQNLILIYQVLNWKIDAKHTIYSFISYGMSGGETLASIGSYTYAARKTGVDYRPLRFAVIEFFHLSATPLGSALGGKLLSISPLFGIGFRNYIGVFFISGLIKAFTALWILITLYDAGESSSITFRNNPDQPLQWRGKESTGQSFASIVFSLTNLSQVFKTSTRARPNGFRCQLFHLILASSLISWTLLCERSIGFQFAQKVYLWDYQCFSYIFAILGATLMFLRPIVTYILTHRYHLRDISLFTIGCLSMMINFIIRGALLKPLAYYVTTITCFFMSLALIGLRSMMARIVDYNEIAQVFTICSLVSSISTIIGALIVTNIFTITMRTYPGMVYHFIALILIYPLGVSLAIDLAQTNSDLIIRGKAAYLRKKRARSSVIEIMIEKERTKSATSVF